MSLLHVFVSIDLSDQVFLKTHELQFAIMAAGFAVSLC